MRKRSDINVVLGKVNGLICAKVHFNLLDTSQSVEPLQTDLFLKKLEEVVDSTFMQIRPFANRSSADIAAFQPQSISVTCDIKGGLDESEMKNMEDFVRGIEEVWREAREINIDSSDETVII